MDKLSAVRLLIVNLLLCVGVSAIFPVSSVQARTKTLDASESLSIIPRAREFIVKSGEVVTGVVGIRNTSASDLSVTPSVRALPQTTAASLATWVTFEQDAVVIPANGATTLRYSLTAPAATQSGGYYGQIDLTLAEGGVVNFPVLATVAGAGSLTIQGDVLSFDLGQSVTGPTMSLFESLPVVLRSQLKNTGNVHVVPSGTIRIANQAGQTVLEQDFNPIGTWIVPGDTELFYETIDRGLGVGKYTLTADLVMTAPNGEQFPLVVTETFTLLPVSFIALSLLALIILFTLFRTWLREHDHHVISDVKKGKRR